jgi:prevent-host-death family protein
MTTHVVNTHEAKSRLSELIREVEDGREVIVARNGHPVAKIISWPPARPHRASGAWADRVQTFADEVAPDEDVASLFEESSRPNAP